MDDVGINFMNMESTIYPDAHSKQPTLREAIEDIETFLEYIQNNYKKNLI